MVPPDVSVMVILFDEVRFDTLYCPELTRMASYSPEDEMLIVPTTLSLTLTVADEAP